MSRARAIARVLSGAAFAVPLFVCPLAAQTSSSTISLGASSISYASAPAVRALSVSPSILLYAPTAVIALFGNLSHLEGNGWTPQGTLAVATFSPTSASGWMGEAGFSAGGSTHPDGLATGQGVLQARMHRLGESWSGWFGGGAGTMWDGYMWRRVRETEIGVALRREFSSLSLRVTPTAAGDTLRYTDFAASASTSAGIIDLSLNAGARAGSSLPVVGGDRRTWGALSMSVWIAPRVAVVAASGTYPVDLTQGFPSGRYLSVAMRLGSARAGGATDAATARAERAAIRESGIRAASLRVIEDDLLEFEVIAPDASSVEVLGDPTAWTPMPMQRGAEGRWWIRFRGRGAVELTVRVNGEAWRVPPGAQIITDEFGGRAGRYVLP